VVLAEVVSGDACVTSNVIVSKVESESFQYDRIALTTSQYDCFDHGEFVLVLACISLSPSNRLIYIKILVVTDVLKTKLPISHEVC
jgi:hypothetical protein